MPFRVDIEFSLFVQARFSNRFPAFYPLWDNYAHSCRDDLLIARKLALNHNDYYSILVLRWQNTVSKFHHGIAMPK